jgi:glutathione S-transferase
MRVLPILDDDGFIFAETGAIVIYIAEKAGMPNPFGPRLSPIS